MITVKAAAGIAAIAVTAGGLAACGTTVAKAPASNAPAGNAAPAATTSAPSPSPSPSQPLTGPVGTTFEVTGPNGPTGTTTTYDVKLVAVEQQATLGQYESLTNGSDHVTAAEFTVTGKKGQSSDDADSDAVAVGSNHQDYDAAFESITAGTNFNSGQFSVSPGQSVTGWVAFELAPGTTIASVQWSAGFEGPVATWAVSK
jgi:hypothetical protein